MEKPTNTKEYVFPTGEWVCLDMDNQKWEYSSLETGYFFGFYWIRFLTDEVTGCDCYGSDDVPSAVIAALAMNYDLDLELEKK